MVKVEFLARSCFDNTKLQIPGFSIFGRHLVPDAALYQALPLRYFVFESVKRKKEILPNDIKNCFAGKL